MLITKTRDVIMPKRAYDTDSGIDFYVPKDLDFITTQQGAKMKPLLIEDDGTEVYHIKPGDNVRIPLGIRMDVPYGYDLTFVNRSSIASKKGLIVGACLIDKNYHDELILNLINVTPGVVEIKTNDKIVQGVIRSVYTGEVIECDNNDFNKRISFGEKRDGGFGSTGE